MPEPARTTRNETPPIARGGWLDSLRIVMASLMVLYHFREAGPSTLVALHPVFDRGFLITNFFLIDSGYVLGRVYADRFARGALSPGDFLRRRALRVAPAHLMVLAFLVAVVGLAGLAGIAPRHPEWFDWSALPAQVFLVQAFGAPGGQGWNAPTWTLSALLACYALFPLAARAFGRLSPLAALAVGAGACMGADHVSHALLGRPFYSLPFSHGLLRALPLFVLGMALARAGSVMRVGERTAVVLAIGTSLGLVAIQAGVGAAEASLTLIALLVLVAGAVPVRRPSRLISELALAAFAVYLTNEVIRIIWFGLANVLIDRLGLSVEMAWVLWGLGVVAALAGGYAFWRFVDRPTQAFIARRLPDRSRKRGEAVPA